MVVGVDEQVPSVGAKAANFTAYPVMVLAPDTVDKLMVINSNAVRMALLGGIFHCWKMGSNDTILLNAPRYWPLVDSKSQNQHFSRKIVTFSGEISVRWLPCVCVRARLLRRRQLPSRLLVGPSFLVTKPHIVCCGGFGPRVTKPRGHLLNVNSSSISNQCIMISTARLYNNQKTFLFLFFIFFSRSKRF